MSAAPDALAVLEQLRVKGVQPTRLVLDSRRVTAGDIFLALPGTQADGRAYIADAVERGAAAILYENNGGSVPSASTFGIGVPLIGVAGLGVLAGDIAHLVYGRPSERLWMCGITGTNGKTSVSQWIAQALNLLGCKCGVIGTLGNGFPGALEAGPNTTPDAVTVHAALAQLLAAGASACTMEVSSIGLEQARIKGVRLDIAVFTNLTRDHLDYHGSMEAYAVAKRKLLDQPGLSGAVVNLDDPFGRALAEDFAGRLNILGVTQEAAPDIDRHADARLRAEDVRMTATGVAFRVRGVEFAAPVVGQFNVANLLAVIGALQLGGETLEECAEALRSITPPPGRMQCIGGDPEHNEPLVVVDYAHSPDALEKVLGTLRSTAQLRGGRLICVFGCGGDRDPGKRPQMGSVAEQLADAVVLTSDNPRSEDPQSIIEDIRRGMTKSYHIEADRAAAIRETVLAADPRDIVVLAGKGHEPYQEIAGRRFPFSDLEAARSALRERTC